MSQINVEVNGRPYAVGCEDGQEAHLIELAKMFDHQVRQVGQDMGQLGDTRLFLMGALLLADELADARGRLGGLHLIQGSADRRGVRAGGRHERLGNGGHHIRPGDPGRDLEHLL